jgi:predicted RNase H-like nuclease (RuvC/YqgF family)
VELGQDARGNLTRIDNALAGLSQRLEMQRSKLTDLQAQVAAAKAEVGKPFPQEEELRIKSARLTELNTLLNMENERSAPAMENTLEKSTRPSILQRLQAPVQPSKRMPSPKHHLEAR